MVYKFFARRYEDGKIKNYVYPFLLMHFVHVRFLFIID